MEWTSQTFAEMMSVMTTEELSPAGQLLEAARGSMSKREAARRASISEGRWRQIVTGVQRMGKGNVIPTTTKPETLIAMARAVRADVHAVLTAAGFEPPPQAAVGGADEDEVNTDTLLYQRPQGLSDERWEEIRREGFDFIEYQIDRATRERGPV